MMAWHPLLPEQTKKANNLMSEGHVVSHLPGPNGERIDVVDFRTRCSAHASH